MFCGFRVWGCSESHPLITTHEPPRGCKDALRSWPHPIGCPLASISGSGLGVRGIDRMTD